MNKIYIYFSTFLLSLLVMSFNWINAADKGHNKSLHKTAGSPTITKLNINNISTIFNNNGLSDYDPSGNSGLVYPKGSGKTAAFISGLLWGAKLNGQTRLGGSAYVSGLQSGKILPDGNPEDPNLPKNRIYRVRPDYKFGNVATEMKEEGLPENDIRNNYKRDWFEWPASDGAPFRDVDGDGKFNPDTDIPGVPGADQTIWFVCNDLNSDLTTNFYGALPMGIEMQTTIWAYSQTGALGNMFFRKYRLINKSDTPFDSMYVSMWSDIDIGDSNDDYAGCDTSLSLGYAFNASSKDATYGDTPPPALGFDFFQGPVVNSPGSTAMFNGRKIYGKKNLPMTSFYYFAKDEVTVTDPTEASYDQGTLEFYNFLQGKIGKTSEFFTDPNTGKKTTFALTGDPLVRKGWIDGQLLAAGDRRIGMASGPFTMAVGDTQEVVIAEIVAGAIPGVDRLSAVGLLKFYDQQAQLAYDNFFDLPIAPPEPQCSVTELDKNIIISWDNSKDAVLATETSESKGFLFQGYNVYQLPSAQSSIEDAKRIATYDLVDGIGKIEDYYFDPKSGVVTRGVKQFGNDNGIKRFISIKNDELNGGIPLVNGKKYFFAVTSYNYNPETVPNNLENPIKILTAIPSSLNPGYSLPVSTDEESLVKHVAGIADATVIMNVVDPTKLTGETYTVGFHTQPSKFSADYLAPDPMLTKGETAMSGKFELNENATELKYDIAIVSVDSLTGPITSAGFEQISESGTGLVVKSLGFSELVQNNKKMAVSSGIWKSTDLQQPLGQAMVQSLINGSLTINVKTAANPAGELSAPITIVSYPWYLSKGTNKILSYQQNYSMDESYLTVDGIQVKVGELTFDAPTTYKSSNQTLKVNSQTDPVAFGSDGTYFGYSTGLASESFGGGGDVTKDDLIQDLELRFTGIPADASKPNDSPIISGGSIATVRSRSNANAVRRVRIPFELWEVERNRQINVALTDRNLDGGSPWGDTNTPEWYRIAGRNYIVPVATPYNGDTSLAAAKEISRTSPKATWFLFLDEASHWDTGDKFQIKYGNAVKPGEDLYSFTSPAPGKYSRDKAKEDINQINVFPNPYYGVNPEEINKYQRFVTFSHLPNEAKIKIFNIAGGFIKEITKYSTSQFERWDLTNESGLPVPSGLYIALIDMADLGTKTLKIAVIQEQQVLDRF